MSQVVLKPGKKVIVTGLGETPVEGVDKFVEIVDQPAPDIAGLKPNEVVIAIKSASVNWVDLLMTSGQYQHMPRLPYTPGMGYSGDIVAVGKSVDPARAVVGDRVSIDGLQVGARSGGDYQDQGGFATYAVVPDHAVLRIPEGLSHDQACSMLGSYETAYHCLITRGRLKAGETVLIHGASGLTGLAAVHVAKILGATVIATGRTDAKLATVKAQGADHVINISNPEGAPGVKSFKEEVKALTGGRGVDVVYDGVGGDISLESMRCVAFGARFLIVGWVATPFVSRGKGQRGAPNANMLPTNLMQMKGLDVLGCPMVIATKNDPSLRPPRLAQIMAWVAEGKITPYVSHSFDLGQVKDAMRAKWRGEPTGGCVLHP